MVDLKEVLYPNKFKIIFFIIIFIPFASLVMLFFGQYINANNYYFSSSSILVDTAAFLMSISFFLVVGLVLSYLIGCIIDTSIQNEKIKITIAIISGIISLLIVYLIYRVITEPVICDPVHVPGNNQTICDPVHTPSDKSNSAHVLSELKVDKSAVENSLEQCINNLKN
ncbi:MAG TPA: hypothetical protein PL168_02550 [Methanobacterium sp.]|jgi:cellulose synthase/poly-beta-1,6-N-acetylglucosamine synthase-like glycosyltransferase|nr:hypothetical protein [Methanobacterium sp.]HOI39585.1 hypothetical protein [Methanobacterium sp.]